MAGKAQEEGAVGAVADAGVGERAEELGLDAGDGVEGWELADEAQRGTHGADGVRARRADADLEEFEERGIHAPRLIVGA